jgi:general secretion pathway protein H
MKPQRGFTILEILVVVAVISIIASTILLSSDFSRADDRLNKHGTDLSKTLQLLMQEAILQDRNFALSVQPGEYSILEYNGEKFVPSEDTFIKKIGRKYDYEDELSIDQNIVKIEKTKEPQPQILILASGEMTVFQWDIIDHDNDLRLRLNSSLLGKITMQGPAQSLP